MKRNTRTPRPKVTLENYKEVYAWYRDPKNAPDPRVTRLGQRLMSWATQPKVIFLGNAKESLGAHTARGGQIMMTSTHGRISDSFVLAGLLHRYKEFEPIRDKTTALVKISLLQDPNFRFTPKGILSLLNRPLRAGVEVMRPLPAYRLKDLTRRGRVPTDEEKALVPKVGRGLLSAVKDVYRHSESLAFYPNGRRTKEDRHVVPTLEDGVGFMAASAYKDTKGNVGILPVGIGYTGFFGSFLRRQTVVIGEMLDVEGMKPRDITISAHAALQECLDIAYLPEGSREYDRVYIPCSPQLQDTGSLA